MCIIMYAPSKKTIKAEKIRTAFKNNPDGAGIMWYDKNGDVHYRKGFTKVEKLINFFNGLGSNFPRAIHCRIATSGKISEKTCHPFPIVDNFEEMGKDKGDPIYGCLMHNGIFTRYTPTGGMQAEYSDTMNYTKQVIYPLVEAGAITNEGVVNLLSEMTSRVLLFLPNFIVGRFGTWTEDKDEHFFASNDTYDHERFTYKYPTYYTDYDNPYWWKSTESKSGCSNYPTYSSPKKTKVEVAEPEYSYSIMLDAKSYAEAYDLMESFLDSYHGLIVDEDYVVETLTCIDTGIYEFSFDSYKNLEQYDGIKAPYYISYVNKLKG